MSFGKNLKLLREQNGIDRKTMASIFNMPYNTLKNYENDEREPGHSFIIKVAKYFNVSADFLLDNHIGSIQKCKKDSDDLSSEAIHVAQKYESADQRIKDSVRVLLGMTEVVDSPRTDDEQEKELA